jgi:tRNA-dihydrouridine synthase
MFRETGVDGVMMGRGVLSNPWLIRQCYHHLSGAGVTPISLHEKAAFVLTFLKRVEQEVPPPVAIGKMKKMGGYLTKGLPGGAHLREAIHASRTSRELLDKLEGFFAARPEPWLKPAL